MIFRNRKSRVIFLFALLIFAVIGCVGYCKFGQVDLKTQVGTLVVETSLNRDLAIDGLQNLRAVAHQVGKRFDIVQCKPEITWCGNPWKTAEAYRNERERNSNLWELRVYDQSPDVAVDTANLIAIQTMSLCVDEFDARYDAWLKTLSPERSRMETAGPLCFPNIGFKLLEKAEVAKLRSSVRFSSMSKVLMEALILQF